MEKILLLADDIMPDDFASYIKNQDYASQLSAELIIAKKEGKNAVVDTLALLFSAEIATNLVASILYDLIKYGLSNLSGFFGAKPVAKIELKNGTKIELPASLSDAEIHSELERCVTLGVKSIQFNS